MCAVALLVQVLASARCSSTGPATTLSNGQLHGEVSDPVGDAVPNPAVQPSPDLVSGTAAVSGGSVTFKVRFAPGTFDVMATRLTIDLNTDQDRSNGTPSIDYYIFIFPFGGRGADVARVAGISYTVVGTVPVTSVVDGTDVTVPLSLLGNDDGRLDFRVRAYAQQTVPVLVDIMPDTGFVQIQ